MLTECPFLYTLNFSLHSLTHTKQNTQMTSELVMLERLQMLFGVLVWKHFLF